MTYSESIQFLHGLRMFGARLGLENTRQLSALAGAPELRLRFIHVAGTNGKGSTCAMLESIYREAGLRVGLYTSPHLVSFAERIQVNRQPIPEPEVARLVGEMQGWLRQGSLRQSWGPPGSGGHPTFFEVVTVVGLAHFARQGCDLVIWETGLGGRLDATNIVTPLASVITGIDFDHQQWLGDTLEQIAAEKAGIIKPGVPVITGASSGRGLEVIAETARRLESPLTVVTAADRWRPPLDALRLPLAGEHQRANAALALATVRALRDRLPVSEESAVAGLGKVDWPGRMQIVRREGQPTLLLDGAHNQASAAALRAALSMSFPEVRPTLVLGVLADKDWAALAEILAPMAGHIVLVPVASERTLAPETLVPVCRRANPGAQVETAPTLAEALARTAADRLVVVTGSLYLIGEAMELLRLSAVPAKNERGLNEWSAGSRGQV